MTVLTRPDGRKILKADEGSAIRKVGTVGPSDTTIAYLGDGDTETNWEDCDYGTPEDVTESDKDAALRRFGVEV